MIRNLLLVGFGDCMENVVKVVWVMTNAQKQLKTSKLILDEDTNIFIATSLY